LDLALLAGKPVAVADVERDEWDARLLAASLGASAWAQRTGTTFRAVPVAALEHSYERRIAPADFAALHDQPERAEALAERLRSADPRAPAWLTGPWLGLEPGTALSIAKRLGRPLGEVTSLPGGPAGARFGLARDALLERAKVVRHAAKVTEVGRAGNVFRAELDGGSAPRQLEARSVVLAIGGLVGGGIRFRGRGSDGSGFRVSLDAPVRVELDGEDAALFSALRGIDLATLGFGVFERVGIAVGMRGAVDGEAGLFAAGDCVAGRARTALRAASDGLRAGQAALEYLAA
jgi:hypothetical protein